MGGLDVVAADHIVLRSEGGAGAARRVKFLGPVAPELRAEIPAAKVGAAVYEIHRRRDGGAEAAGRRRRPLGRWWRSGTLGDWQPLGRRNGRRRARLRLCSWRRQKQPKRRSDLVGSQLLRCTRRDPAHDPALARPSWPR